MKQILILTVLLLASAQAGAAFYTSDYLKRLIENCSSLTDPFDVTAENFRKVKDCGLSTGYILGIYDALNVIADRSKCFPRTVETPQVIAVVESWLQNHPEQMSQSADRSVKAAFGEAWICSG